jgi:hypothetical protein
VEADRDATNGRLVLRNCDLNANRVEVAAVFCRLCINAMMENRSTSESERGWLYSTKGANGAVG